MNDAIVEVRTVKGEEVWINKNCIASLVRKEPDVYWLMTTDGHVHVIRHSCAERVKFLFSSRKFIPNEYLK